MTNVALARPGRPPGPAAPGCRGYATRPRHGVVGQVSRRLRAPRAERAGLRTPRLDQTWAPGAVESGRGAQRVRAPGRRSALLRTAPLQGSPSLLPATAGGGNGAQDRRVPLPRRYPPVGSAAQYFEVQARSPRSTPTGRLLQLPSLMPDVEEVTVTALARPGRSRERRKSVELNARSSRPSPPAHRRRAWRRDVDNAGAVRSTTAAPPPHRGVARYDPPGARPRAGAELVRTTTRSSGDRRLPPGGESGRLGG